MRDLIFGAAMMMAGAAGATDLAGPSLEDLKWVSRPIVIFADAETDPRLRQQLEMLESRKEELDERDVVIIVDSDPSADSALRDKLHPRDFMFVLIGKDGQVKYRKPNPVPVRELIRVIDRMPMRQQEVEAQRSGG